MDLGTMQKKLKSGQYRDKEQFAADLNLIWDNCLVYNAAPQHPLRRNAQFMRKKANHLLEFIGEPQDIKNVLSQIGNQAPVPVPVERDAASQRTQTPDAQQAAPAKPQYDILSTPFGERAPLERSAEPMMLLRTVDEQLGQSHDETWRSGFSRLLGLSGVDPLVSATRGESRDRDWWHLCGRDMFMRAALPRIPHANREPRRWSQHFPARIPARRAGIPRLMARNIDTLHRLHRTHQKFFQLAEAVELEVPLPAYLTYASSDDEEDEPVPPPRGITTDSDFPRLSTRCAMQQISWQVQVILAHAGFNGGHASAVQVLSSIACEFLMGLGRSLAVYAERYSNRMSFEDIVLRVLSEGGNMDLGRLRTYIHNDIERYGLRLKEWLRKLQASYREQLDYLSRGGAVEDENLLAHDGEALALGHFAESIGDDFFGFRELGLDRELGLASLSVPGRLFFGRRTEDQRDQRGAEAKVLDDFEPPPPPPPISRASVAAQIGLLRPWYTHLLDERKAAGTEPSDILPDEPPEKPRYKVPTSGKLPVHALVGMQSTRPTVRHEEKAPAAAAAKPAQAPRRKRARASPEG